MGSTGVPPEDNGLPGRGRGLPVGRAAAAVRGGAGLLRNAGRSQTAAAFLNRLGADRVQVRSAGSDPAAGVNPAVVRAMEEVGIDIAAETPKVLTPEAVQASDVVITMGCGDACPYFPGKRYLDWKLDDPAGQGVEAVRPIRDEIGRRVRGLLAELGIEPAA